MTEAAEQRETLFQVHHVSRITKNIGDLYLSDRCSDCTFRVDNEEFSGHKAILAASSEYFYTMFFGALAERNLREWELKTISAGTFKLLLKYIYTGQVNDVNETQLMSLFDVAHEYLLTELEAAICQHLKNTLNNENALIVFDRAILYDRKDLAEAAGTYIDIHAKNIFANSCILDVSKAVLEELLRRDSLCIEEYEIFDALCRWKNSRNNSTNAENNFKELLELLRVSLMSNDQLLNQVEPTKHIELKCIIEALKIRHNTPEKLLFRATIKSGINVATSELEAKVISAEGQEGNLLKESADCTVVAGGNAEGVKVKLGKPYFLNCVKVHLSVADPEKSYTYYVEVSTDTTGWHRIVDNSTTPSKGLQTVDFSPRLARYVRVIGVGEQPLEIQKLECLFVEDTTAAPIAIEEPIEPIAPAAPATA